jgi:hypothetical protein
VVTDIEGVVKEVPVPNDDPPLDAAYQLIVPADAVAPKATVPELQTDPGVVPVIVGMAYTVAVTEVLGEVVQLPFVAST